MLTRSNSLVVSGAILVVYVLFTNYASAPPNGSTNAPFNGFCTDCHSSSSALNGTVSISGLPQEVVPGQLYQVRLRVKSTTGVPVLGGFEAVSVYTSTNLNAGDFISTSADVGTSTSTGREYIGHRGAKQFQSDSVTWTFNWQAPLNPGSNSITIYYAANITNGNNRDNGDHPVSGSAVFSITPLLQPLTAGIQNQTDVSCKGGSNGSVSLVASGGNPPYSYQWSNGNSSSNMENLSAGDYQATVTDNDGSMITIPVVITEPEALQSTISISNPTCVNATDGSATLLVSGGTPPYIYKWSTGSTTPTINNLHPGTYGLTITDANNCLTTSAIVLTDQDTIPPTLMVHDLTVYPGPEGNTTFSVNDVVSSVMDNCSLDSLWADIPTPLSCAQEPVSVTVNAIDDAGNSSQKTVQLTIVDTSAPVLVCPESIETDNPEVQYDAPVASDNCQLDIVAHISGLASGSLFPEGTSSISYIAADTAGNTSRCSFTITVHGNTSARKDASIAGIRIYQNPFEHNLKIELPTNNVQDIQLVLYDLQSRVVNLFQVKDLVGPVIEWNDLTFPEGIYVLDVRIDGIHHLSKVIKLK